MTRNNFLWKFQITNPGSELSTFNTFFYGAVR
jgi:hypothetical protein